MDRVLLSVTMPGLTPAQVRLAREIIAEAIRDGILTNVKIEVTEEEPPMRATT